MKFTVPSVNVSEFESAVAEICKKMKVEYSLAYEEKVVIGSRKDHFGEDIDIYGYPVEIKIPDLDTLNAVGFTYLGSVKDDEMISVHPTKVASELGVSLTDLKEEIKTFPCAACGKKTYRKIIHAFMEDATKEITVYGSSCAIKRFGVDLERLLNKFERIREFLGGDSDEEGMWGSWGSGESVVTSKFWGCIALTSMIEHGYVSGTKAYNEGGCSTSDTTWDVYQILTNPKDTSTYACKIRSEFPDKMKASGFDFDAIVEWAGPFVEDMEDGDFKFNMAGAFEVFAEGTIVTRMAGYIAYLIFKYWYDNVRLPVESVKQFNDDYSEMSVKERLRDIPVKMIGKHTFDTMYGVSNIYTFKGLEDGRKYKWFSGVYLEDGSSMLMTGTIKEFETHPKYGKAVNMTRCKMSELEEAKA